MAKLRKTPLYETFKKAARSIPALFLILIMGVTLASAQAEKTLIIKHGKSAQFAKSGLVIRFLEVTEDSRCPKGVACVWAGTAKVKLLVIKGKLSKQIELGLEPSLQAAETFGYRIKLDSLTPYPEASRPIQKSQYTVSLKIASVDKCS